MRPSGLGLYLVGTCLSERQKESLAVSMTGRLITLIHAVIPQKGFADNTILLLSFVCAIS